MMMTAVAVNPVPVVPVVSVSPRIAIVPVWSVVSVSVTWIAIIAISIRRITKSNSYAADSD
jgi:hypothetical protein